MRWWLALLAGAALSCAPGDIVGNGQLPPDVPDPESLKSAAGAEAAYHGAIAQFRAATGGTEQSGTAAFIPASGLLADELAGLGQPLGRFLPGGITYTDARVLPEYTEPQLELTRGGQLATTYAELQKVRGQSLEAAGLLQAYAPTVSPALRGHLYAIQGYAEIYLADLFCSGIPLSTVDFEGDFTLHPGSTTEEVYTHAVALFDSALALSADSVDLQHLARLGSARALLSLGRYADAAAAVAAVPDGYSYQLRYDARTAAGEYAASLFMLYFSDGTPVDLTAADREGANGLDYLSSGDPRTAGTPMAQNSYGYSEYVPNKYPIDGTGAVPIADWIEARLIEAEAALHAGDTGTWLARLNHLRQNAITPALPDTTDPGTDAARVDLTFRERAFWLYLTGHRQGDLRRLIRNYGRDPESVYPTGSYTGGPGAYGQDVTAPVPAAEQRFNSRFTGCQHRRA
jgi:hypothetical protein